MVVVDLAAGSKLEATLEEFVPRLGLWIEETLRRFAVLELEVGCERLSSMFLNRYRTMPVWRVG